MLIPTTRPTMTNLHNNSNLSTKNTHNSQVFLNNPIKNSPNVLNLFEKRDALAEKACKLLANKPISVYMVFDFFMRKSNNDTGVCWYSITSIAKSISKSESTVKRATKVLNKLKLITKKQRGVMKTNIYMVNWELAETPPSCKPRKCFEGSTCDPQTTTKRLSNFNDEVTNNLIKKKERKTIYQNPKREIEVDTYYPTNKAYDVFVKEVPISARDNILKEVQCALKVRELELGRKLKQCEANYYAIPNIPKTMALRRKFGNKYISFSKRYNFNESNGVNAYKQLNKQLSEEALKTFSKEEMDYYKTLN